MFEINLYLMCIGGLSLNQKTVFNNSKPFLILIYRIYSVFVIFIVSTFVSSEVMAIINSRNDRIEVLDRLTTFPTHFAISIKVYFLWSYRKKIIQVITRFEKEYEYISSFKRSYTKVIDRNLKLGRFIAQGFMVVCGLFGIFLLIAASKQLYLVDMETFLNGERRCYDIIPLPTYMPFSVHSKFVCDIIILGESAACIFMLCLIIGCDTLFVGMLVCLTGFIKALQKYFQNMNRPELEMKTKEERDSILNEEIKEASKCLQRLIKLCADVDEIFCFISLTQVTISLITLMSILVSLSSADLFSEQFYKELHLYPILLGEFSLYCVFGHQVSTAFEDTIEATYDSPWYSSSLVFRKAVLINMIRLSQPINLTAGKVVPLSLLLLGSVIRMSYSFYTVLRK